MLDPVRNPYTPGAGSKPPALVGRDAELERFQLLARRVVVGRSEKSVMLTGLRGVGKTVLLNAFADIGEAEGLVVVHGEVNEDDALPSLLARLARRSLLRLSSRERNLQRVRRALGVLKAFSLKLPDGPEIGIDIDAVVGTGDSGHLPDDLTDVFVELGEAAQAAGAPVLFTLDELQYATRPELAALIGALHRVSQRRLPVVVVCAGLPQLVGLAGEAKSYAERLFDFPSIGSLAEADARQALLVPARDEDVGFTDDALTEILARSEGYPYFLQEYGKHVWNRASSTTIEAVDVEAASEEVVARLDEGFFRTRIDRISDTEREYLRAMSALGPGPHRSGVIAAAMDKKSSSVGKRRESLIQRGLLYSPRYGETAFTVPQFDQYVRRNFPPFQVRG